MRVLEDSAALPNSLQGDGNIEARMLPITLLELYHQIPRKGTETL